MVRRAVEELGKNRGHKKPFMLVNFVYELGEALVPNCLVEMLL